MMDTWASFGLQPSIDQVGNRLSGLKDYASALMAYRSALAVREDLLRSNAADAETEADISVSCWNISRMKGVTSVDAAEAQKQLERGKEILRGLRERGQLPKPYADFEQKFDGALQRAAGR